MQRYDLFHMGEFVELLEKKGWTIKQDLEDDGWHQFRHCQAWTKKICVLGESGEFDIYVLQSYNWLVAVYIPSTDECIRLIKYSRTTSKQTTQWENAIRFYGWNGVYNYGK